MKPGAFSISLSVQDIALSRAFYEKLGFEEMGGDIEQNWLIMHNGDCVIGLFQGMFERNILTFNTGWDQAAQNLADYTDIREIKSILESRGLGPIELDNNTEQGPASFMITDPDGNPVLFDQHR